MFTSNDRPPTTARKILEIIPYVMRVMASEMRQSDSPMRPAHFQLLGKVTHHSWTLSELAESQAVSAPTMSNTITTLEERGWVRRVRSEEDRRVVFIQATDEGQQVVKEAFQRAEEHVASLLAPLQPAEKETLDKGLDILRQVFEQEVSVDCPEETK